MHWCPIPHCRVQTLTLTRLTQWVWGTEKLTSKWMQAQQIFSKLDCLKLTNYNCCVVPFLWGFGCQEVLRGRRGMTYLVWIWYGIFWVPRGSKRQERYGKLLCIHSVVFLTGVQIFGETKQEVVHTGTNFGTQLVLLTVVREVLAKVWQMNPLWRKKATTEEIWNHLLRRRDTLLYSCYKVLLGTHTSQSPWSLNPKKAEMGESWNQTTTGHFQRG